IPDQALARLREGRARLEGRRVDPDLDAEGRAWAATLRCPDSWVCADRTDRIPTGQGQHALRLGPGLVVDELRGPAVGGGVGVEAERAAGRAIACERVCRDGVNGAQQSAA